MIKNDQEVQVMLERIDYFRRIVTHLRQVETNPANYMQAAGGYLAELDRMNLEVREYLWSSPQAVTDLTTRA